MICQLSAGVAKRAPECTVVLFWVELLEHVLDCPWDPTMDY
jgi:hypothetical protein